MNAKNLFSMEVLVDLGMTRLFQLAEYVLDKTSFYLSSSAAPVSQVITVETAPISIQPTAVKVQPVTASSQFVPTIRFSNEDKMVEGELVFK